LPEICNFNLAKPHTIAYVIATLYYKAYQYLANEVKSIMSLFEIFSNEAMALNEGNFKFLLVSKTSEASDAIIIFGDVKTRHSILLLTWMKETQLKEAYTFGGGKMLVSLNDKCKLIQLFGVSSDYKYTSKDLVERILNKMTFKDISFELDLPVDNVKAQLSSFSSISKDRDLDNSPLI
jgi:hypothetical protein